MATFNYDAARKAGYTDEQINTFLAQRGLAGGTGKPAATQQSDTGLFAGTKTFGRGFVTLSKSYKGAEKSKEGLNEQAQKLIDAALKKPIGDPGRTRLLKEAQIALGTSSGLSEQALNELLPTEKQFAGGALETAVMASTPFLPSGAGLLKAGSLGKLTPTVGKSIVGAATGYGFDKAQQAIQNKEITASPGVGTAVGAALPFAAKLIGSLLKRGTGVTTGAGKDVIQRAIDDPDAVGRAVKEYASNDAAKQSLVERAKLGLNEAIRQRGAAFSESISKMTAEKAIPKATVVDAFKKELAKFNGKITRDGVTFSNTTLTKGDQSSIREAWDLVKGWTDTTPSGYDNLRQALGNVMDDFKLAGNSRANVVVGGTKQALTKTLEENIPGYAGILKEYGAKTGAVRIVAKELGLSSTAKPSTQLNQILRIFKKDPQVLAALQKTMGEAEAKSFLDDVSGAILSEWLPSGKIGNLARGLGQFALYQFGGPAALAGAPALSPRIVGGAARAAGRAAQQGVGTGLNRAATYFSSQAGLEQ